MHHQKTEGVFGVYSKLKNKCLLIMCLFNILSCTSSGPYEAKSPCVSIDSANPYHRSPCSKRPANILWEIG